MMLYKLGRYVPLIYETDETQYSLLTSASIASSLLSKNKMIASWSSPVCDEELTPQLTSTETDLDYFIQELKNKCKASKTMVDTIHEEITKETVSLLNEDWLQYPQLHFCLSQLLAGAILIDGTSALVINSIEPYCRDVLLDAHHERRLFDSASSYSQTPLFAQVEFRPRGVQKAGVCKNRECKKWSSTVPQ
ncbi:hypothetical protein BDC45DRAFT_148601 [Circinella umbellata]|nr:hypothetical protein BDC45DRAFT_148601 [Circinella umbellata]